MSSMNLCGLIKLIKLTKLTKLIKLINSLNFQIQVMRKIKYISPESTEVRLQAAHILASSSLGVDSSANVDECDKSNSRHWGSDDLWAEMYRKEEN